jgi:predicted HD phosphohydrolase
MQNGQSFGRKSHDAIGAAYLRNMGFPIEVTSVVGAHVDAKRYLTATDPAYYDGLSTTSKTSLKFQVSSVSPRRPPIAVYSYSGQSLLMIDRAGRSIQKRSRGTNKARCIRR